MLLAIWWYVNIFLFRIPRYFEKVVEKKKKEKMVIPKRYALQANAVK